MVTYPSIISYTCLLFQFLTLVIFSLLLYDYDRIDLPIPPGINSN